VSYLRRSYYFRKWSIGSIHARVTNTTTMKKLGYLWLQFNYYFSYSLLKWNFTLKVFIKTYWNQNRRDIFWHGRFLDAKFDFLSSLKHWYMWNWIGIDDVVIYGKLFKERSVCLRSLQIFWFASQHLYIFSIADSTWTVLTIAFCFTIVLNDSLTIGYVT
jgi:hypothetical protein